MGQCVVCEHVYLFVSDRECEPSFPFQGEMAVSPGLYAHLTSQLMTLARGKVAVVLEVSVE